MKTEVEVEEHPSYSFVGSAICNEKVVEEAARDNLYYKIALLLYQGIFGFD